jgi:integrase
MVDIVLALDTFQNDRKRSFCVYCTESLTLVGHHPVDKECMPQVASKTFEFKEAPRPNGRCKFYIYGYPKGKREVVWFRTEKDAKKEMKSRNDQITAFGVNAMVTGEEARILNDNVAKLTEIGESSRSIYTAVDEYIARRKTQGKSITVEQLCNRVVAYYDNLLSEDPTQSGNVAMVKYVARKFVAGGRKDKDTGLLVEPFRTRAIKTLDGAEIRAWLEGEKLSAKTRTNCLKYIKRMFKLARAWSQDGNRLLDKDIFEHVEGFGEGQRDETQVFTVEQHQAFLNALQPEFIPLFTINSFSGYRRDEIVRMDWSQIKLERRLIDLPARSSKNGKKTGKRKLNEGIFENLVAWLAPYRQESGPVADFTEDDIQTEITRACKVVGIKWIKNVMRHSFASYAVPIKGFVWTSLQCDHSEKVLRERYHEVVMKADAERYWQIMPPGQPANVIPMVEEAA